MESQRSRRRLEWSLIAYSGYLKRLEFKNHKGVQFTILDIADQLLELPDGVGSCHGCHRLYALSVCRQRLELEISCMQEQQSVEKIQEMVSRIDRHFENLTTKLCLAQASDGSWDENWPKAARPKIDGKMRVSQGQIGNRIRATGHLLEWVSVTPVHLRPPPQNIERAVIFLQSQVLDDPKYCADKFLLASTHAATALFNLSDRDSTQ